MALSTVSAATSLAVGSTLFISNDETFRWVVNLSLVVLDDVVKGREEQEESP
jgi:hypothetical protein